MVSSANTSSVTHNVDSDKPAAGHTKEVTVHLSDCPLPCPLPGENLYAGHPRIYLPIEETGRATCPYCSTRYVLADFNPAQAVTTDTATDHDPGENNAGDEDMA